MGLYVSAGRKILPGSAAQTRQDLPSRVPFLSFF